MNRQFANLNTKLTLVKGNWGTVARLANEAVHEKLNDEEFEAVNAKIYVKEVESSSRTGYVEQQMLALQEKANMDDVNGIDPDSSPRFSLEFDSLNDLADQVVFISNSAVKNMQKAIDDARRRKSERDGKGARLKKRSWGKHCIIS